MKTVLKQPYMVAFVSAFHDEAKLELRQVLAETARINTYDKSMKIGV